MVWIIDALPISYLIATPGTFKVVKIIIYIDMFDGESGIKFSSLIFSSA